MAPHGESKGGDPGDAPPGSGTKFDVPWVQDAFDRVAYPNPKCERALVEYNGMLR